MSAAWTRWAWKELRDLPKAKQAAVIEAVSRFAADPFGPQPNAKPSRGEKNAVRLPIGDYRVILHRSGDTIEVRAVVHRRQAYR
jgi:mRNA-degrading endonuclease RelE of RelBE toxin-antitoxin system